jgi:ABC-type sugar transport systems, permease components
MYRETFVMSNYGYGSSIAVVLSAIIIVLSWAYLRSTMKAGDA